MASAVAVCHDRDALPFLLHKGLQPVFEPFHRAAVIKGRSSFKLTKLESQSPPADLRRKHLTHVLLIEQNMGSSSIFLLNLDRQSGEVRRRRPKPIRRHLWIVSIAPVEEIAVNVVRLRGKLRPLLRQRLSKCAVPHSQRMKDESIHELWKRLAGNVCHEKTHHNISPAGVSLDGAGNSVDPNGSIIRRDLPVQHLEDCGEWL